MVDYPFIIKPVIVGITQTNCYVVGDPATRQGAVIDPGGHPQRILDAVKRLDLDVRYVFNTHGHFDHMMANAEVLRATGAQLAIHPADREMMMAGGGAFLFGLPSEPSPAPDLELSGGQVIELGAVKLEVLLTPGHTPGGVSLYAAQQGAVFVGDALFQMGVGRTDLPGGSWETLLHSIRDVLFALPPETVVYPGHGPQTSIRAEKAHNPWA